MAWRDRGGYRPRERRPDPSTLAPYADWLRARAPEVESNAAVLPRELVAQGVTGSPVIVRRFVPPLRAAARVAIAPGSRADSLVFLIRPTSARRAPRALRPPGRHRFAPRHPRP